MPPELLLADELPELEFDEELEELLDVVEELVELEELLLEEELPEPPPPLPPHPVNKMAATSTVSLQEYIVLSGPQALHVPDLFPGVTKLAYD